MHAARTFVALGVAAALSGCPGGDSQKGTQTKGEPTKQDKGEKPRGSVTISEKDKGSSSQITRQVGVNCEPGKRVVVEAEITGHMKGTTADSVIGEALCGTATVANTTVTAKPPIGFDRNQGPGNQTTGAAACRVNVALIPGFAGNPAVWKVTCNFY